MKYENDIERAKFDKLQNEFNAMTLKLEDAEKLADERKKTVDSLSAELGKYKRKQKRKDTF